MEYKSSYLLALLSITSIAASLVNFIHAATSKVGVQAADVALLIMALAVAALSLRLDAAEKQILALKGGGEKEEPDQPQDNQEK